MKAIVRYEYGSPDVIKYVDMEIPTPKENQVLIKVRAASINSYDWRFMSATPFLVRTGGGLLKPKDIRLGADFAGQVEAVGSKVTLFKPGDEVFGEVSAGAFAGYVCVSENDLVRKPANVSFENAAASPMAGLTALQGLRDTGKIQSGQKVLVNGASGGVGSFAVQIAKHYGAEVTGVCSSRNVDVVRSIGADHVIDYTKEDFTKNNKQYDLIYDVAANHSVFAYKRVLSAKGKYVMAGFSTLLHLLHVFSIGSWLSKKDGQTFSNMGTASLNNTDLAIISDLLESGRVVPFIDGQYPLEAAKEAFRYYEEKHPQGKIIISVSAS